MASLHWAYLDTFTVALGQRAGTGYTGGGEGPLAVFCVQDDTIYVDGKPVSLNQAERLTENLASLEQKLDELKTLVNSNKLIESQGLSREVEALGKQINSAWLRFKMRLENHKTDQRAARPEPAEKRWAPCEAQRAQGALRRHPDRRDDSAALGMRSSRNTP